jgi:quercetin dioxygenase-like cupin family protein
MELSERIIRQFESEGFANTYEWQGKPGMEYPPRVYEGKTSVFVTDGSVTFNFGDERKEVSQNQRFDIPAGKEHSIIAGPQGCIMIIGEEMD